MKEEEEEVDDEKNENFTYSILQLLFLVSLLSQLFSLSVFLLSPSPSRHLRKMQDFENAVAAPTPGGAGGKAALNNAATAAPTPRRALGELKTNANLTPAAAAPLGARTQQQQQQQQQQKMQVHAPFQRPTGKPPVAPTPQQKKVTNAKGVTVQTAIATANAAEAAPSLRLPPVEHPAGMTLDQQLACEELRAQRLARGAAQAICAGVPLSLPTLTRGVGGRYSSSSKKRLLGPAAAAAAAARTFTVFDDDDDDDDDEDAERCRPSSAPSTPPGESSFLGDEEQGKEKERERKRERKMSCFSFSYHLPFVLTSSSSLPHQTPKRNDQTLPPPRRRSMKRSRRWSCARTWSKEEQEEPRRRAATAAKEEEEEEEKTAAARARGLSRLRGTPENAETERERAFLSARSCLVCRVITEAENREIFSPSVIKERERR